ncbi:hypothetical protein GW17_00040058 [Ensete ventricosum]|nr:hypothetical protein GW17_00040058 [Ensete ventricosum]
MESSNPCSHRGRALVMKGVEEVENTEANSKYQDNAEGQRSERFARIGTYRPYRVVYCGMANLFLTLVCGALYHFNDKHALQKSSVEVHSTTQQQRQRATGSQGGVLQPKQKIEDSAKCEEMQRLQWLRRGC